MVSRSLSPFDVMKSTVISTFSFAPHSRQSCSRGAVAVGTQWSQNPHESLPAAKAPRTKGAAIAVEASAAVFKTVRRVSTDVIGSSTIVPVTSGVSVSVLSAVDKDLCRGDVGGILAAQEEDRACDVLGVA